MGKVVYTVEAINGRLKAAGVPVRVRQIGKALYLRCSKLPPKPGDQPGKRYQIAKGPYSKALLASIEREAHKIWDAVISQTFSWEDHDPAMSTQGTVAEWVGKLEAYHLTHTDCSDRTFQKHWREPVYDRLPQQAHLTPELLLEAVLKTPEHTRLRRQTCQKLTRLAQMADLSIDLRPYQGSYGRAAVEPRELPSDEEIEHWYLLISDPRWQRIYARIVVFGLRPSESFFFELLDPHTARVIDAKSGQRRETKAFHPRWAEQWSLVGDLPNINWRQSSKANDITGRIATQFYRYGVGKREQGQNCDRYDFRHAWCVRVSIEYEVPVEVAARWAGHSAEVHQAVYARWLRQEQSDRVYELKALNRPG